MTLVDMTELDNLTFQIEDFKMQISKSETFTISLPPGITQQAILSIVDILSAQGYETSYTGALLLPHQYLDAPEGFVTLECTKHDGE